MKHDAKLKIEDIAKELLNKKFSNDDTFISPSGAKNVHLKAQIIGFKDVQNEIAICEYNKQNIKSLWRLEPYFGEKKIVIFNNKELRMLFIDDKKNKSDRYVCSDEEFIHKAKSIVEYEQVLSHNTRADMRALLDYTIARIAYILSIIERVDLLHNTRGPADITYEVLPDQEFHLCKIPKCGSVLKSDCYYLGKHKTPEEFLDVQEGLFDRAR